MFHLHKRSFQCWCYFFFVKILIGWIVAMFTVVFLALQVPTQFYPGRSTRLRTILWWKAFENQTEWYQTSASELAGIKGMLIYFNVNIDMCSFSSIHTILWTSRLIHPSAHPLIHLPNRPLSHPFTCIH